MPDEIQTKVTNINGRYHCRLLRTADGSVVNEMACREQEDIGYCMRCMLRMYDKCGGTSLLADASRHRKNADGSWKNTQPKGKIWFSYQLPVKE